MGHHTTLGWVPHSIIIIWLTDANYYGSLGRISDIDHNTGGGMGRICLLG